jgi:methyltransferase (TIGR00027 family)
VLDDPYARFFLQPSVQRMLSVRRRALPMGGIAAEVNDFVVCRHRYMDECLLGALEEGVEQVVVLGAGYDTRAWRFSEQLAGRPVFEVDFPATSRRKGTVLDRHSRELPETNVHRVEVDFEKQSFADRLVDAGFEVGARSFFVWEGVSYYLTRRTVEQTLAEIHRLGGEGSHLVADFWYLVDDPEVLSVLRRVSPNLLMLVGEPFLFGIHPEDLPGFLGRLGLEVQEIADAGELRARYLAGQRRRVYPAFYLLHAGC